MAARQSKIGGKDAARPYEAGGEDFKPQSGQLDMLCNVDTGFPKKHFRRNISSNGPTPGNPFGKEISAPDVVKHRTRKRSD